MLFLADLPLVSLTVSRSSFWPKPLRLSASQIPQSTNTKEMMSGPAALPLLIPGAYAK